MKIVFNKSNVFSKKISFLSAFFITFFLLIVCTVFIFTQLHPVFEQKASNMAKIKAIDIINKATDDVFNDINSANLVDINLKENGEISSVRTNSIEMNKLKTLLSKGLQSFTKNSQDSTIHIPIGALTPYPVLQGVGYRIPVKISADGFSKIDFKSEFSHAGLNQVKHKIYMTASVDVLIISKTMTKTESVTAEIPVAETIIVGTVPNYYGDSLNIVGR